MKQINPKPKILVLFFLLLISSKIFPQQTSIFNQIRLAQTYRSVGQLKKAKTILLDLYKKAPNNIALYDELNKTLIQLKDYDTSEKIIKERIKTEPQNISLYGDLGTTYFLKGEEKKATKIWEKGIETNSENAFAYRTIANYMIENRAIENAIDVLKRGNKISKNHTLFAYDLAQLYAMTMKFDKATEAYCNILSEKPKQIGIIKNRILSYIHVNGAEEPTLEIVKEFYDDNDKAIFLELLADLYLKTNKLEKAFESYSKLEDETTKNGSKLYHFAQIAYRLGNNDIAAKAFNKIIKNYKSSSLISGAKIGYAKALEAKITKQENSSEENWKPLKINNKILSKTNYLKIISAYQEIIKEYPNNKIGIEANYRIGKIYFNYLNNLEKAEEIFSNIIASKIDRKFVSFSKYELSKIAIIKNNLSQAEKYLLQISKNSQITSELKSNSNFLLARIKTWQGKFDNAIKILNDLKENPKDKNTNDALELLQILNIFKSDSTNLKKYFYADNLVMQNNFKTAATVYKEIAEDKNLFILKDFAALNYVRLLIALNKYQESAIFLNKILNCDEANIYEDKFLFLLGIDFYYGLKQPNKAKKILTKLLEKYPTSLYYNKARKIITEIKSTENKKI
jgi:tetratricopeptide (TPR) repeat protein